MKGNEKKPKQVDKKAKHHDHVPAYEVAEEKAEASRKK
jgi:hypothetical protein